MTAIVNYTLCETFEVHSDRFVLLFELDFIKPIEIDNRFGLSTTYYWYNSIIIGGKAYGFIPVKIN